MRAVRCIGLDSRTYNIPNYDLTALETHCPQILFAWGADPIEPGVSLCQKLSYASRTINA